MALRKARAAIGPLPEIEAATEELLGKGNAVDAVVAGVFAACAVSPGVLLGPVQLLVGGAGAGTLAIDGRVRQPGSGAPRPRGFVHESEIPDAARVGVPWLPASMSVAIATAGSATLAAVMAPAIALAKGTPRAEILSRIASRGPRAIEERPIAGELLAAAGRPSGGLLTAEDLSTPRPDVQKASMFAISDERAAIALPWAHLDGGALRAPADVDVARVRAVAAVDRNSTFAIACWDEPTEALLIPELELRAPFFAEPVRRGRTRARPGEPRPAAGAIALVGPRAAPSVAFAAYGAHDAYDVLREAMRGFSEDDRIEAHGEARLVALLHAQGTASTFRSS